MLLAYFMTCRISGRQLPYFNSIVLAVLTGVTGPTLVLYHHWLHSFTQNPEKNEQMRTWNFLNWRIMRMKTVLKSWSQFAWLVKWLHSGGNIGFGKVQICRGERPCNGNIGAKFDKKERKSVPQWSKWLNCVLGLLILWVGLMCHTSLAPTSSAERPRGASVVIGENLNWKASLLRKSQDYLPTQALRRTRWNTLAPVPLDLIPLGFELFNKQLDFVELSIVEVFLFLFQIREGFYFNGTWPMVYVVVR